MKEYSYDIIAQIVVLKEGGHSVRKITEQLRVSRTTVKHWLQRFREEGRQEKPKPKKWSRLPRKTTKRVITVLKCAVQSDVKTTARKLK